MRHKLLAGMFGAALLFASAAQAALQIQVLDDGNPVAGVLVPGAGSLVFIGSDANFSNITVTSTGVPIVPDPTFGTINVDVKSNNTGTHVLTILSTQTDLTGGGSSALTSTFTYNNNLNPGNVTSAVGQNYVNASNAAFGQTTLIAQTPNAGGLITQTIGPIAFAPPPAPLFSETEKYTFTVTGPTQIQTSSQIAGTIPEPASLALLGVGLLGLGIVTRRRRSGSDNGISALAA